MTRSSLGCVKPGAVVVLLALAIGVWGYTRITAPGPVPSENVLVDLARDEWSPGFCGSGEYKWPCLVVTDIRLDRSDMDWEPRDTGEDYRACFDIDVQVETTRWDYAENAPSEPRTYVDARGPLHQCADVHYFTGDDEDASAWSFVPIGLDWWKESTQALLDVLCPKVNGECLIV